MVHKFSSSKPLPSWSLKSAATGGLPKCPVRSRWIVVATIGTKKKRRFRDSKEPVYRTGGSERNENKKELRNVPMLVIKEAIVHGQRVPFALKRRGNV